MKKKDSRILAIASREIVRYHKTCYEGYTRADPSPTGASDGCGESLEDEYANIKSETYQMIFDYIRSDVLTNEKIVRLTDMTELHLSYVSHVFGCWKNQAILKEAHQTESPGRIRKCLHSFCQFDTLQVAKYIAALFLEKQDNTSQSSQNSNILRAATDIREAVQRTECKMPWLPHPSDLSKSAMNVPKEQG